MLFQYRALMVAPPFSVKGVKGMGGEERGSQHGLRSLIAKLAYGARLKGAY